jgi:hypothetical protein
MTKTLSDVAFDDSEVTDLSFDIIPNPVQNEINIKFYYIGNELIELELYNPLGQKIYQENIFVLAQQSYKVKFDVNNLPTGFYFCKVRNSKQSVVKKFILSE